LMEYRSEMRGCGQRCACHYGIIGEGLVLSVVPADLQFRRGGGSPTFRSSRSLGTVDGGRRAIQRAELAGDPATLILGNNIFFGTGDIRVEPLCGATVRDARLLRPSARLGALRRA
jgi:hypothetical protein